MTDLHARYVGHLRAQAKTSDQAERLPCPYCSNGRFPTGEELWHHAKREHGSVLTESNQEALRATAKAMADRSSEAATGGTSTPDLTKLSLLEKGKDSRKGGNSPPFSPRPGKKRAAGSDFHRRAKRASSPEVVDPEFSGDPAYSMKTEHNRPKPSNSRLYDPRQDSKGTNSPYLLSTPNPSSEDWSVEANRSQFPPSSHQRSSSGRPNSPARISAPASPLPVSIPAQSQRQPGILELHRYDPRYPGLLLQPDSRPISQEQLASEVKSIYAGLTMVETKCIHVDRAQAAIAQDSEGESNTRLANDHWQALIALHRTLLHEHHDFFLASQHPSASPALRRLATKYSMPARMWKHGIHSFLELLRRRLPESLDYMLAFIYLAYQMMALLYETVPAFEETWIECLGDLGRYRMAIEDEDLRDRETWAGVARSWYSKAADKDPSVGRLYHHLAILARPNALQQLYYYARSLTCVKPFASARESILTLLDPILGRPSTSYSHSLPIDTSFIQAHAVLFEKLPVEQFDRAANSFQEQLDNHIGRVTTKWKEQGVYIAVTNIAGLFDYGAADSALRLVLHHYAKQVNPTVSLSRASTPSDDDLSRSPSPTDPEAPSITEDEIPTRLEGLINDFTFSRSRSLTFSTLCLVLRRIGDKNVLPHVHVLLSFLSSFASIPYVTPLINGAPWSEIVTFLNTLIKSERPGQFSSGPVFPPRNQDNIPLPEDYQIRGQIWSQWYFPANWFDGEHDEEERSLELASTIKSRTERILRLGCQIASLGRWMSFDSQSDTFTLVDRPDSVVF